LSLSAEYEAEYEQAEIRLAPSGSKIYLVNQHNPKSSANGFICLRLLGETPFETERRKSLICLLKSARLYFFRGAQRVPL
jgi:hypothetical protein